MSKEKKADENAKFTPMETATENSMIVTVKGEEGRVFRFSMPFFAPLPECYNAAVNVANEIAKLFNEAVEKEKLKKEKLEEGEEEKEEKKEERKAQAENK